MKKLFIGIMVLCILPFVMADELDPFTTPQGAEVRLLQLEEAISRNIAAGEEILEAVNDTSELESVLDELKLLLQEVQDMELTGNGSELAQSFVAIKAEAINLTKKFREEAKLKVKDVEKVRERVKERKEERKEEYEERIKNARNKYNSEKIIELLEESGINNTDLASKVESGDANYGEIRSELAKTFRELSNEEKKETLTKIKEIKTESKIKTEEFRKEIEERKRVRIEAKEDGIKVREEVRVKNKERNNSDDDSDYDSDDDDSKDDDSDDETDEEDYDDSDHDSDDDAEDDDSDDDNSGRGGRE